MLALAILIFAVSALVVSGLLYGFSSFIMRGLDQTGPRSAIATIQAINRTVFTPWVMLPFVGTAPFGLVLALIASFTDTQTNVWLLSAAAALYLFGVVAVTGLGNVPLNEQLDTIAGDDPDAAKHWARYFRLWTRLNHLRTALGIMSAVMALLAI